MKRIANSSIELRAHEVAGMATLLGVQLGANDSDAQILGKFGDAIKKLEADARALWAVRVLDAYVARDAGTRWWKSIPGEDDIQPFVSLFDGEPSRSRIFDGATPDAARIAAATALVVEHPELDPDAP